MSCGCGRVAEVDSGEDAAVLFTLCEFSLFGCEFRYYKKSLVHLSNYRLLILASKKLVMLQVNFQPSILAKVFFFL